MLLLSNITANRDDIAVTQFQKKFFEKFTRQNRKRVGGKSNCVLALPFLF